MAAGAGCTYGRPPAVARQLQHASTGHAPPAVDPAQCQPVARPHQPGQQPVRGRVEHQAKQPRAGQVQLGQVCVGGGVPLEVLPGPGDAVGVAGVSERWRAGHRCRRAGHRQRGVTRVAVQRDGRVAGGAATSCSSTQVCHAQGMHRGVC